jgi:T-complex protein 1 subunit eta
MWYGVDMESESISDNMEKFVWEPALVKVNMIASATEAACLILSVDETVKNPQAEQPDQGGARGRGRGRGRR